ncbi:MAG: NADH-quinone oxidoreductase subunit N [Deltaproteobacteria bacterium]|nr:MAG: NADH-quinone oxidoreductase subunit N [Deltaproteobacteria bacterium]
MSSLITPIDIASTLPFIVLCLFGMVVLLLEVFQRQGQSRSYLAYVSAVGFATAAFSAWLLMGVEGQLVFHDMNYIDGFSKVTALLMCTAGAVTCLIAPRYLAELNADRGEFYALILFSAGGMIMMVSAADFIVFFMALELMSIAVYALAAYVRSSRVAAEAGFKYFLMGAFASAIMLYGIALVYGATGTTNLAAIGQLLSYGAASGSVDPALLLSKVSEQGALAGAAGYDTTTGDLLMLNYGSGTANMPLLYLGITLVIVSAVFKVGAVPFHMWLPDAYSGAPSPVGAFMASAVKAAAFASLLRLLALAFFDYELRMGPMGWVQVTFFLALLSMAIGNLVAIAQTSVKRMLAYSSIAHTGYMLVAITAMGYGVGDLDLGASVVFYLFAYVFGTVGAFGILAYLTRSRYYVERFSDLNGLGYRYPALGVAMTLFMLSSAGIPPTAGFIAKFQVFKAAVIAYGAGVEAGEPGALLLLALVVSGILFSVVGVYYYLKVIVHLYMRDPVREVTASDSGPARVGISVCAIATLVIGLFPGPLLNLSEQAMSQMEGRHDGVYVQYEDGAPIEDLQRLMREGSR